MFLLDTNVVSELRKAKPHGGVLAWVADQDSSVLFVSAITVGEIQLGIEKTRKQDAPKARQLEVQLEYVLATGQVLPLDAAVCRAWAQLMHRRTGALLQDAFIAATASVYRLTIATRNVRDFRALGSALINPFDFR